jgi:hypothetical protein
MIDKCYIKISNDKSLLLEVLRKLNEEGIKWASKIRGWNYIPEGIVDAIYIDKDTITYSSDHENLCMDYQEVSEYRNITNLYTINKKELFYD